MTVHEGRKLRVILFPGGAPVPMWVAESRGAFAREELAVDLTRTPSSVFLAEAMMRGDHDVALATFDNVVGYVEGQGEVQLDPPPDFVAFMSIMHGGVHLMASPEIRTVADLRGKALGVDAIATGYSLAMIKLLQGAGLEPGDYSLEPIGNTAERQKLLLENRTVATILTSPLDLLPRSKGYRELARFSEAVGPYQSICGFARRAWVEAHGDILLRFIRATAAALDWVMDPAHRAEAVTLYRRHLPDVPEAAAVAAITAMTREQDGFTAGGRFDKTGVENVLRIRTEFAKPRKLLDEPSRYVDESYLCAATGATNRNWR